MALASPTTFRAKDFHNRPRGSIVKVFLNDVEVTSDCCEADPIEGWVKLLDKDPTTGKRLVINVGGVPHVSKRTVHGLVRVQVFAKNQPTKEIYNPNPAGSLKIESIMPGTDDLLPGKGTPNA